MELKNRLTDDQLIRRWKPTGLMDTLQKSLYIDIATDLEFASQFIIYHGLLDNYPKVNSIFAIIRRLYEREYYNIDIDLLIKQWIGINYTPDPMRFYYALDQEMEMIINFVDKYYPIKTMTLQESNDQIINNMKNS